MVESKKVVRLSGYDDLETGRKLAESDLTRITNIGLATKEDGEYGSWTDDHILCFIGKFDLDDTTYIIDILWDGEDAYAAFQYANESEKARKRALVSIESWIRCTTDTGGFYDPATGIISDVRGIVHLDENGEPSRVSGYEK